MNRFCLFLSDFVATPKSEWGHEKSVFLITSEIKSTKMMNMKTITENYWSDPLLKWEGLTAIHYGVNNFSSFLEANGFNQG